MYKFENDYNTQTSFSFRSACPDHWRPCAGCSSCARAAEAGGVALARRSPGRVAGRRHEHAAPPVSGRHARLLFLRRRPHAHTARGGLRLVRARRRRRLRAGARARPPLLADTCTLPAFRSFARIRVLRALSRVLLRALFAGDVCQCCPSSERLREDETANARSDASWEQRRP